VRLTLRFFYPWVNFRISSAAISAPFNAIGFHFLDENDPVLRSSMMQLYEGVFRKKFDALFLTGGLTLRVGI